MAGEGNPQVTGVTQDVVPAVAQDFQQAPSGVLPVLLLGPGRRGIPASPARTARRRSRVCLSRIAAGMCPYSPPATQHCPPPAARCPPAADQSAHHADPATTPARTRPKITTSTTRGHAPAKTGASGTDRPPGT